MVKVLDASESAAPATPAVDPRYAALEHWVREVLSDARATLSPASGDASFRRYFRVRTGAGTLIAMDAPPDKEDCGPYLDVTSRLRAAGIACPEVRAQNLESGFLLVSDLGERLYLDALTPETVDQLYGSAMETLLRMQSRVATGGLPPYDHALLHREMSVFRDWLVGRHLNLVLTPSQSAALDRAFDLLARSALDQPTVFVHRDYHSRNLLCPLPGDDRPGVIDFQDAVVGPVTYDLVSLLRDCYVAWPRERVEAWALGFHRRARDAGLAGRFSDAGWLRRFDLMGVQRHLKASGIFCRLLHRDGKHGYLRDVPRTLAYIVDVAKRQVELESLGQLVAEDVLPRLGDVSQ